MKILSFLFSLLLVSTFAQASVDDVIAAHEEALLNVRANKIPPPVTAWMFAYANTAANAALEKSGGNWQVYRAAFAASWLSASKEAVFRAATRPEIFNLQVEDGQWRPTPTQFAQPLLPHWGVMPLWSGAKADRLLNGLKAPSVVSSQFIQETMQVLNVGGKNSRARTPEQTAIAHFWAAGGGTITPPGMWIHTALRLLKDKSSDGAQAARLMEVLTSAVSDAGVLCWKIKYDTFFWRPVSAIQTLLPTQKQWLPLLETPPFPSYVSGHSSFSAAAGTILEVYFGSQTPITVWDSSGSNAVRKFANISTAVNEAGMSRIFGGIHYASDNRDGLILGQRAACAVIAKYSEGLPVRCRQIY